MFWSALAISVIIPHFNSAHVYPYWTDGGALSPSRHAGLGSAVSQFGASWPAKLRTTLLILLPVGFLALGSPLGLVALPSLLLRFVSTNSAYWGDGFHYNATVMPIVFLAAVDALARLQVRWDRAGEAGPAEGGCSPSRRSARSGERGVQGGRPPGKTLLRVSTRWAAPAAMVVLAVALVPEFPLSGVWQPATYQIGPHVQAEDAAMARVPSGTTVEATLTMVAPLAARDDTYWIGNAGNPAPRYIVFDATDSGWSPAPADPLAFVEARHPGTRYQPVFADNGVYVFRRISS